MKIDFNEFKIKMIILLTSILLITKLFFSKNILVAITNTTMDLLVLILFYMIFNKIQTFIKNKNSKRIIDILYYIILLFNFTLFFMVSVYINDMLIMKYTLFAINIETIKFGIEQIIKPIYFLYLIAIIGIITFVSHKVNLSFLNKSKDRIYNNKTNKKKSKKITTKDNYIKYLINTIISILLISTMLTINYNTNPYSNTVVKIIKEFRYIAVEINQSDIMNTNSKDMIELQNQGMNNYQDFNLSLINPNKNILVFVYEQTEKRDFNKIKKKIKYEENFFKIVENNTHEYTNYYTTVQDSRTSIWTSLSSTFIPYESYIGDWNNKYGNVLYENNLVDYFNYYNYTTIDIASINSPSLILDAHNWDEKLKIKDVDYQQSLKSKEFFCQNKFSYESACEDNIIIEDLKSRLLESKNKEEKIFLLQEFIYGHGQVYINEIGLSRPEYYNKYLLEVYKFLVENNMQDDTTIVIIADHGEKGGFRKSIENYNIPLLVIDSDFNKTTNNEYYTNLNFKDLLFKEISKGKYEFNKTEYNYIIGETGTNEIAYLEDKDNYFTAIIKPNNKFLISDYNGLEIDEIKLKLIDFINYRKHLEELNKGNNYYCERC